MARRRPARWKLGDVGGRDVRNVGLAAVDGVDFPRVEVDAGRREAGAGELDGERQADVAEADDADVGRRGAVSFWWQRFGRLMRGRRMRVSLSLKDGSRRRSVSRPENYASGFPSRLPNDRVRHHDCSKIKTVVRTSRIPKSRRSRSTGRGASSCRRRRLARSVAAGRRGVRGPASIARLGAGAATRAAGDARTPKYVAADKPSTRSNRSRATTTTTSSAREERSRAIRRPLTVKPWTVKVDGLVDKPGNYGVEDLVDFKALEERVYRHRCVERWSMVMPWIGVPLSARAQQGRSRSRRAKFVEFTTLVRPSEMPGLSDRRCSTGRTSKGCAWTKRCIR